MSGSYRATPDELFALRDQIRDSIGASEIDFFLPVKLATLDDESMKNLRALLRARQRRQLEKLLRGDW